MYCLHMNQHYFVGKMRELLSFYYEFERECCRGGNKLSNVRSFIILRLVEGLTSINKDNSANFLGEKVQ